MLDMLPKNFQIKDYKYASKLATRNHTANQHQYKDAPKRRQMCAVRGTALACTSQDCH